MSSSAGSTPAASRPIETHGYAGFDGAPLVYHEVGEGRPVVLLHGYFSDARTNWIRYGHAETIAAAGFRVILPDLRAHGESARPHDAAAYPADALAMDGEALIAALGIEDYDLGGYSLGARTVVRMLDRGIAPPPRRVVLAGMGLEGLLDTQARAGHFRNILTNLGSFERGTPEWMAEAFLKTTKGDPQALLGILDTFVDTPIERIAAIRQPVLVLAGRDDADNGSHAALAARLPIAELVEVSGGHMSAVVERELGTAIARFVSGDR
ncbi:alpha/beta fold hydrolase [Sphingomonas japonica]|uniref:Pimeloyl-ACP methyl ester carboxylesterase n=1 Tax=Sphingomonas japonica TaxID=511662 RepID=A0ABX0U7C7_9SPHN|nr:alpha/beta fold hydrolase [Sphingomonas japonica]NIJ24678.1 pimeloyl-ACP methyl ester carboxylesterase [Sphingomonas japonica]